MRNCAVLKAIIQVNAMPCGASKSSLPALVEPNSCRIGGRKRASCGHEYTTYE